MNATEFKTFESLVGFTQTEVKKCMSSYLRKIYPEVIETKDYIYAKGVAPVALVAHMDTVFSEPVKNLYYDQKKNVMWSSDGLGADDRAGIFAILQILKSGLRPHVVLTTDEEKGCLGAEKLAEIPCPFENIKYVIELDRRGFCDCVFYDCDNDEFVEYVESFGFIENWGTFSDISELCPKWQIAGVNLSVGYENEHSYAEVLHVNALFKTIERVKKMITSSMSEEVPVFKYIPVIYSYDWFLHKYGKSTYACKCCGKDFPELNIYMAKGKDNSVGYYCSECADGHISWCHFCNEPFETEDMTRTVCDDCEASILNDETIPGNKDRV